MCCVDFIIRTYAYEILLVPDERLVMSVDVE